MKLPIVLLLVGVLLGGAAPPPAGVIAPGTLRVWYPRSGPLALRAGRLAIAIAPAPCGSGGEMTEGCRFDGVDNRAVVTVAAAGLTPLRLLTNRQADYYRLGVFRLGRRDRRLGVLVVNDSGGSAGLVWVQAIVPVGNGYRRIDLRYRGSDELDGAYPGQAVPVDVSGDGRPDFVMRDPAFDGAFGCNACSPRPPVVLSLRNGRSVDRSAEPSTRGVFRRDIVGVRAMCRSRHSDRNGNCAAYLADAARLGRFAAAWRDMLVHYERDSVWTPKDHCRIAQTLRSLCPPSAVIRYREFPDAVRAFLVRAGYITPAQAAAAPLS